MKKKKLIVKAIFRKIMFINQVMINVNNKMKNHTSKMNMNLKI